MTENQSGTFCNCVFHGDSIRKIFLKLCKAVRQENNKSVNHIVINKALGERNIKINNLRVRRRNF